MNKTRTNRRTALTLGGVSALASLAGCLDLLTGDEDDDLGPLPDYHEQIVPADADDVFFAYADFDALEELEETVDGDLFEDESDEDPFLALPMTGAFVLLFSAGFTFEAAGIGALIEDDRETQESDVQELLLVNETIVALGSFEVPTLEQAILAPPEDEFFDEEYEAADPVDGYSVYRPASPDGAVIALREDTLIFAQDGTLEDSIATVSGDGTLAVEEYEDFDWALRAAGDGTLAFGGFDEDGFEWNNEGDDDDDPLDVLEEATGFASSMTLAEDSAAVSFAMVAPEIDDADLEDEFEESEGDLEFEYWDDRALVEGDFDLEDLE